MYRIGIFSKLGKVTVKTLHHYDDVGLLKPSLVDDNGYRYYDTDQLFLLHDIVALRQMGFSISEITDVFAGRNVSGILEQRRAELLSERDQAADRLFRLEHYIKNKEGKYMDYKVVIKDIPSYTVFSRRLTIPNYAALMNVMPETGEMVGKANPGLKCIEPEYCFNVYHDGEYKKENIDVEVCQAVTERGTDTDEVTFKESPAVKVASVMHKGAYDDLGQAYAYGIKWVEENGYKISDYIRESYIDGVWNKDDINEWLTEIQIPIEKA